MQTTQKEAFFSSAKALLKYYKWQMKYILKSIFLTHKENFTFTVSGKMLASSKYCNILQGKHRD